MTAITKNLINLNYTNNRANWPDVVQEMGVDICLWVCVSFHLFLFIASVKRYFLVLPGQDMYPAPDPSYHLFLPAKRPSSCWPRAYLGGTLGVGETGVLHSGGKKGHT